MFCFGYPCSEADVGKQAALSSRHILSWGVCGLWNPGRKQWLGGWDDEQCQGSKNKNLLPICKWDEIVSSLWTVVLVTDICFIFSWAGDCGEPQAMEQWKQNHLKHKLFKAGGAWGLLADSGFHLPLCLGLCASGNQNKTRWCNKIYAQVCSTLDCQVFPWLRVCGLDVKQITSCKWQEDNSSVRTLSL